MINLPFKTGSKTQAQAMVEFALALPILLLLIIGVLEAGRLMFIYGSVTTAAREAVRYASAVGVNDSGVQHFQDCAGIRAAAKNVGFLQAFQDSDIHITYDRGINVVDGIPLAIPLPGGGQIDPTPPADSCPLANPSTLRNGDRVVVQVSLLYSPILRFTPLNSFVITSTSARTVIVNVAIEVTALPQSWVPGQPPTSTSTPTATSTNTPTATQTSTPTATFTHTPTNTSPPMDVLMVVNTPLDTNISISSLTPSRTPTSTPQPSCANIFIDRTRFNYDGFEARVRNNNLQTAYLIDSTLVWDLNYAPPMYLSYFSFNAVQYFNSKIYTSPLSATAPAIAMNGNSTQAMWIANFDNQTFVGAYGVSLTFNFPGWGPCTVTSGILNSSPTPSFTPTVTHTPTPTATAVNCTLVTHGILTRSGDTLQMSITNDTGATLTASQVTLSWNHNDGHHTGNDKTLRLRRVSLDSAVWTGNVYAPSYTITPYSPTIPTGTSTITFTFHQSYDDLDYTERVLILLANNGCANYSIDSSN